MKASVAIFIILSLCCGCNLGQRKFSLLNTKWECKINNSCIDYLEFGLRNKVKNYSCELDYKFSGTYKTFGNQVQIIEIDDSHSEGSNDTLKYIFQLADNELLSVNAEILKKIIGLF